MKKKVCLILILCTIATVLCGCSFTSYNEAIEDSGKIRLNGYFTVVKEWTYGEECYYTVYANDTHVMYFYFDGSYTGGITPLYNTDGTLQIWEGE